MKPKNQRPYLEKVPLEQVLPPRPGTCMMTMNVGQWDNQLAGAYREGWTLLELDDHENPVAAYRRPEKKTV